MRKLLDRLSDRPRSTDDAPTRGDRDPLPHAAVDAAGAREAVHLLEREHCLVGVFAECSVDSTQRVVHGTEMAITAVLVTTRTGAMINTAYIERLNATFRSRRSSPRMSSPS